MVDDFAYFQVVFLKIIFGFQLRLPDEAKAWFETENVAFQGKKQTNERRSKKKQTAASCCSACSLRRDHCGRRGRSGARR